ncbi:MAG: hypothetical protein ACRD4M_12360 [Candidatus Acidiferrales bacterium]
MNFPVTRSGIALSGLLLAAGLALAAASPAWQQQQQQQQPKPPDASSTTAPTAPPASGPLATAEAPKVDPAEEADYKAFYGTDVSDAGTVIKLGEGFVQKYPSSRYNESVYSRLTEAYFSKQQLDKMYAAADKALLADPDDVNVLVLVGWVIPHNYDPNDMEADRRLDKAEAYEKHALTLIPTMAKPGAATDDQFAKAKASATSQAHSGLGLIYFRRQDFADSISELQLSEQDSATPDPTDFYVMGVEYSQLKKYSEAAAAFDKCASIPSGLADRCKQSAADAKKQAAAAPK